MKPHLSTVTTSIAYPNTSPHIGYALEQVQADFFARMQRRMGREVYFQTGTDEHGLKVQRSAQAAGQPEPDFVRGLSDHFEALATLYGISHDRFIRTTDADHISMAQALWAQCERAGDIYKAPYRAWYDVKEEAFLGSVEQFPDPSVFGVDPKFIEQIDEENYFFRLSRFQDQLIELIQSGTLKVTPAHRAAEMSNLAREGLQDVSISRQADRLSWGIPVPSDPSQVMYVWYDALSNYATGCMELQDGVVVPGERWQDVRHCVGKDIQRFHILLWPGMLLSAGLPLPQEVFVHGFLTVDGKKMSKSLGNGVDPFAEVARYGLAAVRWHLLKDIAPTEDADYNRAQLVASYNADLANTYGNLLNRVRNMVVKYAGGIVVQKRDDDAVAAVVAESLEAFQANALEDPRSAANVFLRLTAFANERIDITKPWAMAKDEAQADNLAEVLYELAELVRITTGMLACFVPEAAERVSSEVFPVGTDCHAGYGYVWPTLPWSSETMVLFPKYEPTDE